MASDIEVIDLDSNDDEEEIQTTTEGSQCYWCVEKLPTEEALLFHLKYNRACRPFVCQCCGRSFSSVEKLQIHAVFHPDFIKTTLICRGCKTRFETTGVFELEIKSSPTKKDSTPDNQMVEDEGRSADANSEGDEKTCVCLPCRKIEIHTESDVTIKGNAQNIEIKDEKDGNNGDSDKILNRVNEELTVQPQQEKCHPSEDITNPPGEIRDTPLIDNPLSKNIPDVLCEIPETQPQEKTLSSDNITDSSVQVKDRQQQAKLQPSKVIPGADIEVIDLACDSPVAGVTSSTNNMNNISSQPNPEMTTNITSETMETDQDESLDEFFKKKFKKIRCPFCPKLMNGLYSLMQHSLIHKDYIFYQCKCEICGKVLNSVKQLGRHLSVHLKKTVLLCEVCGLRFNEMKAYGDHQRTHNTQVDVYLSMSKSSNKLFNATVTENNQKYEEEKIIDRQRSDDEISKYIQRSLSSSTKAVFTEDTGMSTSFSPHSPKREKSQEETIIFGERTTTTDGFNCQFCPLSFHEIKEFIYHNSRNHESYIFFSNQCPSCDTKTNSFDALGRHIANSHGKRHTKRSTLLCGYCDQMFSNGVLLESHRNIHRGTASSDYGKNEQREAFARGIHRDSTDDNKWMEGELIFMCDYCLIAFESVQLLGFHYQKHEEFPLKGFNCGYCSKSFISLATLESHASLKHEHRAVYICSLCGEVFDERLKRQRHELSHGKPKPKDDGSKEEKPETSRKRKGDSGYSHSDDPTINKWPRLKCYGCHVKLKDDKEHERHMKYCNSKWKKTGIV